METNNPIIIGVMRKTKVIFAALLLFSFFANAQNPKIKCYFNHPVNNAVSSGTNAVYLNGTMKDTLIAYINRAKYSIDFCVYNFYCTSASDPILTIATAVNNAYARGVTIRWIGNGSSSNNAYPYLNSNIHTVTSPTVTGYGICHNKFMVIDANSSNVNDPLVWTGSMNFTSQQNGTDFNNVVILQDQALAQAYTSQFNQMWGSTTAIPNLANSKFGTNKTISTTTSFTVNGTPVQVYFSPKDGATAKLTAAINSANNELFFGIYTFTDNNVATTIKTKITAGITAYGIEDSFSQTYSPYTTLSPSTVMGPNLKVYNGGSALYHNKVMLIDALHSSSDPQVCTGSFNWSGAANTSNDENFIIIHDPTLANEYYQSLCKNFTDVGGAATACPAFSGIDAYDYGREQVAVYPNPANGILNISVKNAGVQLTVKIIDQLGNVVKENTVFAGDTVSVGVDDLPVGLYFVNVLRGDQTFTKKFVKQ
ncbi:MAG: phospholipase D-like domain-containing protein [Bacteroidia bacterium]